jgi:hypothetical protein
MSPLPIVYAYTDQGILMEGTRWKPHRVSCTLHADHRDRPGELYAVKFCPGRNGAAAMISEVVCRELMRRADICVLDAAIVHASEGFVASWNNAPGEHEALAPGAYFGTRYRTDVISGPPPDFESLEDPRQIVDIWVIDTLVCNLDRNNEGNLLLMPVRQSMRLIAADQSDCFCGADSFVSENWLQRMNQRPASEGTFVPRAIAESGGGGALRVYRK